jgi:tRNA nucleotidyltransferase/poly(A) polymerase
MSDYIYILESHLSPDQNLVLGEVMAAAGQANLNLFLTGGAMRDMLAGFRIRDLDFVVEGAALKLAKAVAAHSGAAIVSADENRKSAELLFRSGATAQIAMSRQEKYPRGGGKPQVSPATIQEDLRGRDFTCNAVALSLNKTSRGLLLDPLNGLADIERHELRAVSAYGFYDDPTRLLRLVRLGVRLGFATEERTAMQVANAREAQVEKSIPPHALGAELKLVGAEDNAAGIIDALAQAGLLGLFSAALAENHPHRAGLAKFEKIARMLPDELPVRAARFGPFMVALTEKLSSREKQALAKHLELSRADTNHWLQLEARSKKLAAALRSPRIRKPSQVYQIVSTAAPDQVMFLLYASALKPVQDRLRAYFQKYLPAVQEITPEEWATVEAKPSRQQKAREEFIANRLDRRAPRKPPPAPPPPVPEPVMARPRAVGQVRA